MAPTCSNGSEFSNMYTNPLACKIPICGLMGPLSAMIGPCVDNYSCCIVPVLPTCHWRWDAVKGQKMGNPLEDPPDSQEGEAQSQLSVFGGDIRCGRRAVQLGQTATRRAGACWRCLRGKSGSSCQTGKPAAAPYQTSCFFHPAHSTGC